MGSIGWAFKGHKYLKSGWFACVTIHTVYIWSPEADTAAL